MGLSFWRLGLPAFQSKNPRFISESIREKSSISNGFGPISCAFAAERNFARKPTRSRFIPAKGSLQPQIFDGGGWHFRSRSAELSACTSVRAKLNGERCIPIASMESAELIQGLLWEGTR